MLFSCELNSHSSSLHSISLGFVERKQPCRDFQSVPFWSGKEKRHLHSAPCSQIGKISWFVNCAQPVDLLASSLWSLWNTANHVRIVSPHQFGLWSNVTRCLPYFEAFSLSNRIRFWCKNSWLPFVYSRHQCPAEHIVHSIRELSALKLCSTSTCSRTHHHPQQPPNCPKREGRWSRRVVFRSSPELKSGASRPPLSIRCTGKKSRLTSTGTRSQTRGCMTTGDTYAKDTWWTNMPSCWCYCTLRHAQVQHAQQSVPCLVYSRVRVVHASLHGSPAQPALSIEDVDTLCC